MPTVADGKVYVTTGENAEYGGQVGTSQFACVNAYNGQLIWTLPIEAFAPRESVAIAYGNLYIIPGNVTTAVDAISGNEYFTAKPNVVYRQFCFQSAIGPCGGLTRAFLNRANWPLKPHV